MCRLKLRLQADTDGTGALLAELLAEVSAEVSANGFSGIGSAWFHLRDMDALGLALSTSFPLQPDVRYEIKGGFWDEARNGELAQTLLGLRFYPVGATGGLGCRVELSTPLHEHDRPDGVHSVKVELNPHYEALRSFGLGLRAMAAGQITELLLQDDFADSPDWTTRLL